MKINFTKAEYRQLMELIYLGNWMLTAHDVGVVSGKEKYELLSSRIYSHAKEMGYERWVTDAPDGVFGTANAFDDESSVRGVVEEYDGETFWQQLIDRLTERDVRRQAAAANETIDSPEDYFGRSTPIEGIYMDEFEAHGLERLEIRRD